MGALGVLSGVTRVPFWGEEKQGAGGPVGGEAMEVEPGQSDEIGTPHPPPDSPPKLRNKAFPCSPGKPMQVGSADGG